MSNNRGYLPRWGELPIEQYLIRHWDHAVTESPDQQRVQLVRQFLDLDEIPQEWFPTQESEPLPRTPTEEEINAILRPWRSADLRRRAWHIYTNVTDEPIFLRTHYNPEDDEKMDHWACVSEEFEDQAWWACLNNAQLYNFGSDWQRVYDILPEIAGPSAEGPVSLDNLSSTRSHFKTWLSEAKRIELEHWKKDPHRYIEVKAAGLLRAVTTRYILLADQEAFETDGRLRLIYLDNKRNIVRETRVDADGQTITDIIMAWFELTDPSEVEDGITGDRYRVTGDLGRELYQLTESDLADP
ncbi:uncharacterized protein BDW43DRAFT_321108 [Aspergillus alliaceus]|uniref:uncharacterized protein n=1 Tax=Petromyces alliaceus TaxID=209559 RepID=UPI0012A5ED95|nr:uncharacterized protein BDW43DRAFT_321108 [Aspergillus alliaceus]KAB8237921.1 hypothetical protein BDW43DRAFT_321108 [Aspergillus alliaceus]